MRRRRRKEEEEEEKEERCPSWGVKHRQPGWLLA
jgi:hypothetical protein